MVQEISQGRPAPSLICAALLAASATLALAAAPATAVVIPPPSAEATTSARSTSNDSGTQVDQSAPLAAASNSAQTIESGIIFDTASAQARATLGGAVRGISQTEGASGTNLPSRATATASWVANFNTAGAVPNTSVGIDFNFGIDGDLSIFNNASNAGVDDIFAKVDVTLRAHDASGATTVFDGGSRLRSTERGRFSLGQPDLLLSGDWADPARAGDFMLDNACSGFSCTVGVDAAFVLGNAFFIDLGQIFAVELILSTEAFMFGSFETGAIADFFNTVNVSLGTSTPGVTVTQVSGGTPAPAPVPEPGTLALMLGGMAGMAVLRRRDQRPEALLKGNNPGRSQGCGRPISSSA